MKTITTKFYEVSVRLERMDEAGMVKRVTEKYAVDALSITEAESRITTEVMPTTAGDFEITQIKIAQYKEFVSDETIDEKNYYKVKVSFITLDEKTNKEKRNNVIYLVEGTTPDNAIENTRKMLSGSLLTYAIQDVVDGKFVDVFIH